MTPFEKVVEKSFTEYLSSGVASLKFLFPKMRMSGYLGKTPAFVQVGKAPYDVDGYFIQTGQFIACEIKENGERHNSMHIVGPDKKGTGLQYHQLVALVHAHGSHAFAALLWNNGGEIGILDGSRLTAAKASIDTAIKAEEAGYPDGKKGAKSIPWGHFSPVKSNAAGVPLWLPTQLQLLEQKELKQIKQMLPFNGGA